MNTALDMSKQVQEKNDSLISAKDKITTIELKDFKGEFYKNLVDEEYKPECIINIPEMSIKAGETVLLSGNSGTGKSTFLTFLRDGDIDNKGQIIVNGNEVVDKIGYDKVSMCEAKMRLNSYNILQDITGKTEIKSLSEEQRNKLSEILRDLGLSNGETADEDEFMKKCEYKSYEQFSTGQQKRLELAKVLFAINDDSQVILLDETVSNVQKELGENAFKLIKKYTNRGEPKIVIMISHNIEVASKYADKRYHIDSDGTVAEIPLRTISPEER